jgi:hypothetical protein
MPFKGVVHGAINYCLYRIPNRILTLSVLRKFSRKLFHAIFAYGKAPGTVAFQTKEPTHILHEVLLIKGFKVIIL